MELKPSEYVLFWPMMMAPEEREEDSLAITVPRVGQFVSDKKPITDEFYNINLLDEKSNTSENTSLVYKESMILSSPDKEVVMAKYNSAYNIAIQAAGIAKGAIVHGQARIDKLMKEGN